MVPKPDLKSKFTLAKIHGSGQLNVSNLAIFAQIHTTFDTKTENEVAEQF